MKILVTGGSSFTGYWFIRELAEAGHEVVASFTRNGIEDYRDLRATRVRECLKLCTPVWNCRFGNETFLKLVKSGKSWDLLCHHGAFLEDYRSIDFDFFGAVQSNTYNIRNVLEQLVESNCNKIILTGSVFEQGGGTGDQPLRAFSPYGLSKGLTSHIFAFWCQHYGVQLHKFVIPNPFGPFEEKRFTAYLVESWLNGRKAGVRTPDYVRDNIHVSLLAKAYRHFAETIEAADRGKRLNPSGYIESQESFAKRLASEMRPRLGKPCELEFATQEVFEQPRIRVNFDVSYLDSIDWNESKAWDQMAEFYLANWVG